MPLFKEVKLAERYDIAIMSTKGMSVTASRELVDQLCAEGDIPLLVLGVGGISSSRPRLLSQTVIHSKLLKRLGINNYAAKRTFPG